MTTIPDESTALVRQDFTLPTTAETQGQLQAIAAFQEACRQHLVADVDYGTIPGTQKPTLLKPGAEKLVRLLGLADEYQVESVKDWERPFFQFQVTCGLRHLGTGSLVATGVGECNSLEARYRWRWVFKSELDQLSLPTEGLRTRSINTRNGKAKQYRIENDDIFSQVNTILKMSKKRALVDAALSAGRLSNIFTQDMEDLPGRARNRAEDQEPGRPVQPRHNLDAPDKEPASSGSRRCEVHDRPWAKMPDGRLGHPVDGEEPCYQDASTPPSPPEQQDSLPDAPQKGSVEALRAKLEALGWTWDEFQARVLNASWEEFEALGGNPRIAWSRFQRHNQEEGRSDDDAGDNPDC